MIQFLHVFLWGRFLVRMCSLFVLQRNVFNNIFRII